MNKFPFELNMQLFGDEPEDDVVEETVEPEQEDPTPATEPEKPAAPVKPKPSVSNTQRRIQKATEDREQELLERYGVESFEELDEIIASSATTADRVNELTQELEATKTSGALMNLLNSEHALNPELLIPQIDLNGIENTPEALAEVVNNLKTKFPTQFGTVSVVGDSPNASQSESSLSDVDDAYQRAIQTGDWSQYIQLTTIKEK